MSRSLLAPLIAVLFLTLGLQKCLAKDDFCFYSPGKLDPKDNPAAGDMDRTIYIPSLQFPLKVGPGPALKAHLNSQIYGYGGMLGPGGSLSDPRNYSGCWRDTYCEGHRTWKMPLCPLHIGHQGDDIRPDGPEDNKYEAIAFSNGYVALVTKNTTVIVIGDDGTECRYLHLNPESIKQSVHVGQRVKAGQSIIGRVSDWMNGTQHGTSRHLHFDCAQTVSFNGSSADKVHVPVYTSLILSYAQIWGFNDIKSAGDQLLQGSTYEQP